MIVDKIICTNRFKKDVQKLIKKNKKYKDELKATINALAKGDYNTSNLRDHHELSGKYKGYEDVHFSKTDNNLILIYRIRTDGTILLLEIQRVVTHKELGQAKPLGKFMNYRDKEKEIYGESKTVITEAVELHDELNPKFWDSGMQLKPDVRQKILEIVDEFSDNVSEMVDIDFNPLDIYIVGSNASYNYTKYSDLDVHVVINFDTIDDNTGLVQSLMNFQKSAFNTGYDIQIYGTDVELYVEDINSSTMSNGIFSVMSDQWVKKPQPIEVPEIDIEDDVDEWKDLINEALDKNDPEEISDLIDDLYILRKNSLLSEGEFGKGNQTFKEIRNLGLLGDLKDAYMKLRSKELSLEQYKRVRRYY